MYHAYQSVVAGGVCPIFARGRAAARAQWAVIDAPAIAQLIQEVQTMQQQLQVAQAQLQQAQQALQSMTGDRGMEQLLERHQPATTCRRSWTQITSAAAGRRRVPGTRVRRAQRHQRERGLVAGAAGELSAADQQQILAARQTVALRQALAQEALANASNRFAAIQSLIAAISTAGDQKAILDLQTRISAELRHAAKRANQAAGADSGEPRAGIGERRSGSASRRIAGQGRFDTPLSAGAVAVRRASHGIFCDILVPGSTVSSPPTSETTRRVWPRCSSPRW